MEPERETKSISVEATFEADLVDRDPLTEICARDARQVAARLRAAGLFARTVTLKIRRHDFSTQTRSTTLRSPIDSPDAIARLAGGLLDGIDLTGGIRLLGVGAAGLTDALQDHLFELDEPVPASGDGPKTSETATADATESAGGVEESGLAGLSGRRAHRWPPGVDVEHTEHGRGWVWGAGLGRVTVRFETWQTGPGPVRTFAEDDPVLRRVAPLPYLAGDTGSPPAAAATSPRNSP